MSDDSDSDEKTGDEVPRDRPSEPSNVFSLEEAREKRARERRSRESWRTKTPALPAVTGVESFRIRGVNGHEAWHTKELDNLRASMLTDETIDEARLFYLLSPQWKPYRYGKNWPSHGSAGILFPFFHPGESEPFGYRIRPTGPRKRRGTDKLIKYEQPEGTGVWVYFPPLASSIAKLRDPNVPLVWTEGEKKALLLAQLGFAVVGLTGVSNWRDSEAKARGDGTKLHPDIVEFCALAGRAHVVVFDGDARSNESVMSELQRLSGALIEAGAKQVGIVLPPEGPAKGIDDFAFAHGTEATLALLSGPYEDITPIAPDEGARPVSSFKALRDAGLDADLRVPAEYEIDRSGAVWLPGPDPEEPDDGRKLVAESPILVARVLRDLYSHEEQFELRFRSRGRWIGHIVARSIAKDRGLCGALTPFGAHITAGNVLKITEWLDAFERVNGERLRVSHCVSRAGWHHVDGTRRFMLAGVVAPSLEDDKDRELPELVLNIEGDARATFDVLGPRPNSKLDEHVRALRDAWNASPECVLVIAASFAAPLLEPLGLKNFAIHLCGESSRGKTSMLRAAASVYGDPTRPEWVASWNATGVGLEQRAAALCDLPQFYDEIGASSDSEALERAVYMLVNGEGRTRSTKELKLRATARWRTIIVSTGEHELAPETSATGAQVRVLSRPVSGFGELTGEGVNALVERCIEHAGQAGSVWLAHLAGIDDEEWRGFRAAWESQRRRFETRALKTGNPLLGRVAGFYATLSLAEVMVSSLFDFTESARSVEAVFDEFVLTTDGLRPAGVRARDVVRDWITANPALFPGLIPTNGSSYERKGNARDERGLCGFRVPGATLFIPDAFRTFLRERSFEPHVVAREWIASGWSARDSSKELTVRRYVDGAQERFFLLSDSARSDA